MKFVNRDFVPERPRISIYAWAAFALGFVVPILLLIGLLVTGSENPTPTIVLTALTIPASLVCGVIAYRQVKAGGGMVRGQMLAFAGMAVSCVIAVHVVVSIVSNILQYQQPSAETGKQCMGNLRAIALTASMYADDHGGAMPDGGTLWESIPDIALKECNANLSLSNGYGYNTNLSHRTLSELPQPEMLLLAADGGNAYNVIRSDRDVDWRRHYTRRGGKLLCALGGGWRDYHAIVAFADGHVEAVTSKAAIHYR